VLYKFAFFTSTFNVLTLRMSGEQIRLQVPPKLFGVNSWIAQMIRQWIPDCWSGDRKCTGPTNRKLCVKWFMTPTLRWRTYHDDLDPLCDRVRLLFLLRQLPRLRQLLYLYHWLTAPWQLNNNIAKITLGTDAAELSPGLDWIGLSKV